ncbi:hypothetical protein [Bacillus mycoides]|nr:hypothetical protein [Bacillus mycoides]
MHIDFTIPEWLIWAVGIPCGLILGLLAVMGFMFMWSFRNGFR